MKHIRERIRKAYLSEVDATVCRICGKTYKMLGKHVAAHGHNPESYKLQYGLPLSVGLTSSETFKKLSDGKVEYIKNNPDQLSKMRLNNPPGSGRKRISQGKLAENLKDRAANFRRQQRLAAYESWMTRKAELSDMWLALKKVKEIALHFNVSEGSIRKWARIFNLPKRIQTFSFDMLDSP